MLPAQGGLTPGHRRSGHVPQTLRVGRIDGVGRHTCEISHAAVYHQRLVAVLEIASAHARQQGRSRQQHGRCRALFGALAAFDRGLESAGVLLQVGGNGAGMNGIGEDALVPPAAGGFDDHRCPSEITNAGAATCDRKQESTVAATTPQTDGSAC